MIDATPSLRVRLAGMMAVLFLGGTVALYLAARSYAQTAADLSYDRLLSGSALSIAETLVIAGSTVQVDLPYAALDMLSAAPDDRVFYRVYGPGQQTVTGDSDLPQVSEPRRLRGESAPQATRFFDAQYRGEMTRFALLGREVAEPGVTGWIWVQVGQTRRAREALARELVLNALAPIGLMTVLALGLVWFGIARALRPLRRVGDELAERRPSDLQPITAPVPADIAPLVDAVNGFMRRLDANMDTLRVFIAEAAHQMRTPLAALRAQAQVAMDDDPAELRGSLRAIERNAAKLTRLLNQLLSDATVIHRSDLRRFESFDLVHAIRTALREVVPQASSTEVHFDTDLDEVPYTGDVVMLREAIKNLVDNALKHGNEDGSVDVDLRALDDGFEITVADRGPGIAVDRREHVFERFSRGEGQSSGAGLGLAIVRQVVHSHGGTIELDERPGGGLLIRVRLPEVNG